MNMDFKSNQDKEEQKIEEEEEEPKKPPPPPKRKTAKIKIGDKIVEEKTFLLFEGQDAEKQKNKSNQ